MRKKALTSEDVLVRVILISGVVQIRVKKMVRLEQIERVISSLRMKSSNRDGHNQKRLCYCGFGGDDTGRYLVPTERSLSCEDRCSSMNGHGRVEPKSSEKYYFNTKTQKSVFETTKQCIASCEEASRSQPKWNWDKSTQMHQEHTSSTMDINQLTKPFLLNFNREKTSPEKLAGIQTMIEDEKPEQRIERFLIEGHWYCTMVGKITVKRSRCQKLVVQYCNR